MRGGWRDRGPGRVLWIAPTGRVLVARGQGLWSSDDDGARWTRVGRLPAGRAGAILGRSRLLSRLAGAEPRAALRAGDRVVVATRREVLSGDGDGADLVPARFPARVGPRAALTLSVGPDGRVVFGEYRPNRRRREVHLFVSEDGGRSFEVGHTLPAGLVRHVHHLVPTARRDGWWVLVGDHGSEPGIGWLSLDLDDLRWVVRGSQRHRAVCLFDLNDHLVYGTDSETEPNHVVALDPATGRVDALAPLPGSCLHACRFGATLALSTAVEPSRVNRSRVATVWTSADGARWTKVLEGRRGPGSLHLGGYACLALPRGESGLDTVWVSGARVRRWDGRLLTSVQSQAAPPAR